MTKRLILSVLLIALSPFLRATHVMGGDLTWECQGGQYVFQLVFYRDCNGADINPVSENIKVWNHGTINQITLGFISREDVSPICTEVAAGPTAYVCGIGAFSGNGIGAIEKIIYRSAPINLTGTPPPDGWIFTYENFSRNGAITNLQSPSTYGITIVAKIFNTTGINGGCVDNSPQFLQDPYFVSCAGEGYEYNMNAVDPDLDSLAISFAAPLDYMDGQNYNLPSTPAFIPYVAGFSFDSPTPSAAMNPGNIPAAIDPSSGNITFLSNNTGSFVVKVRADSYRQGQLIASVEREMQLIVTACSGVNSKPNVLGPFAGSFETTINAGDLVNFTLNSTDTELLQNGTPQSNLLTASGLMFSSNYTSGAGCIITPCATLNSAPTITGLQGASVDFSWQTDCDHLVNPFGFAANVVPYHFVFKFQDDYCPTPKITYKTITINVVNPGVIEAPEINCTQAQTNGDLLIQWTPVTDPGGTFVEYQVHTVQNGLEVSVPILGSSSVIVPGGATAEFDYFLAVVSGCNGNTIRYSDTLKNIFLEALNPANGTAVLQWNEPTLIPRVGMGSEFEVSQEYPAGTWSSIATTPYSSSNLIDTITICEDDVNYQIILQDQFCPHISNIDGDFFEDMITPDIPVITSVSIDTLTGNVVIVWNENAQEDTYGYVIYLLNSSGIPIELDTVWGINNTSYSYSVNPIDGPLSYTVAAFDSCFTNSIPATYQTSAKAEVHSTQFLTNTIDICGQSVNLSWTPYVGWDAVLNYTVHYFQEGESWQIGATINSTSASVQVDQLANYCFVIEANHSSGANSFSNRICTSVPIPGQPEFNYLSTVTVVGDSILIKHYIDDSANLSSISIQKEVSTGQFEEIIQLAVTGTNLSYFDSDVDVMSRSYRYRIQLIDSCGNNGVFSNFGKSILLQAQNDDLLKMNYLTWSAYSEFDGSIIGYRIYRGLNGEDATNLIATVPNGHFYFNDDVSAVISNGKICYRVEAVESMNSYGFAETALSNRACIVQEPLIFIPNAFMPDGINKVFLPIVNDFDPLNYELLIFSRWGEVIFKSNAYDEGWNGTITSSGQMAQHGTYLYVLSVKDGDGNEIIKRGHVTLVK